VAPMITLMTKHFMFNIRWISILKFLYFNLFSDSCIKFLSDCIAASISKQILSFTFLIIMSGLFARTSLSVCISCFHCPYYYYYYYYYYLIFWKKLLSDFRFCPRQILKGLHRYHVYKRNHSTFSFHLVFNARILWHSLWSGGEERGVRKPVTKFSLNYIYKIVMLST
jgi:hypothetical protein